ncbi:hypothetical protein [Microbacterium sp. KR10-403]|uniref:hypothetical protein n=1 Tax=Microbacterium sp. KR10-403 TaxID=3158581 RepID=UPI0032E50823
MAWELIDNIRGPKGDKGDTGTIGSVSVATLPAGTPATVAMTGSVDKHVHFEIPQGAQGIQGLPGTLSSASAESVPAEDAAEVIMSGTTEVKHAHFKIPRGLPGVNAIENDDAVAAYVAAVDSATRAAVDEAGKGLFPVYRLWDGSAYPDRVAGAANLFFGPVDPGLQMDPATDFWALSNATNLDTVIAQMLNTGSALNRAVRTAGAVVDFIPAEAFVAVNASPAASGYLATSAVPVLTFPAGVNRTMGAVAVTRPGVTSVRFRTVWATDDVATGTVLWRVQASQVTDGAAFRTGEVQSDVTATAPTAANQATISTHTTAVAVSATGGPLLVRLSRIGGTDTCTSPAGFVGMLMEYVP